MPEKLIITNGDNAVLRMQQAGIVGEFLPWRDALHDGPVPAGLLFEARSIVRTSYLANTLGYSLHVLGRDFAERNATARNHGQYDRVELWFEPDLYDQLQLIELLDFFADEKRKEGLFLVQADELIAPASLDAVRDFAEKITPITTAHLDSGRRAWQAFTARTPEDMAELAKKENATLPYLAPALQRFLLELPALGSGLSLTEERALNVLLAGQRTVLELFRASQTREQAPFLGDLGFFHRIETMAFAPQPLLAGVTVRASAAVGGPTTPDYQTFAMSRVRLTEEGRAALSGRFDHAATNGIDRWFGGTHLNPKNLWRRDKDGIPVPPWSMRS